MIIKVFEATHPHWSGLVYFYADGSMCRPGVDSGKYERSGPANEHLIIDWDRWQTEELEWDNTRGIYLSENESFILKPVNVGPPLNNPQIIIGVLSSIDSTYQNRRQRCEASWLPVLENVGIEVVFLVGTGNDADSEPKVVKPCDHGRIGTELQIPCADDYESLPQKTAAFCRWAIKNRKFTHLFKCDDDTYIVPKRLLEYDLTDTQYTGYEWESGYAKVPLEGSVNKFSYASGGAGYFLDEQAAAVISENMLEPEGVEDMLVGEHLIRAGISLKADPRFVAYSSEAHSPTPENNHITGHAHDGLWHRHNATWKGRWEEFLV